MFDNLKQAYLPKTQFPSRRVDRAKCEKCGRCVTACPTSGIIWGADGFPEPIGYGGFDQACINCWNCVAMCPTGALVMEGPYRVEEGRYKTTPLGRMTPPDPLGDGRPWEEIEPDLTPVEKVLYKRRSNRLFKKKPVDRALLHRVLEAGRFAPSSGNCQPWKFIVITDPAVIREIEEAAMAVLNRFKNLYLAKDNKRHAGKSALFTLLSLFMVNKMDPRPFAAMEKVDQDQAIYWRAPAVILLCKNTRGIANPDLDIGICAQNMVLAAHSLGLGTCIIGLAIEPLNYPHLGELRKRLGITAPWQAVTSIAVGWPKGKIDGIVSRDNVPVEWIV